MFSARQGFLENRAGGKGDALVIFSDRERPQGFYGADDSSTAATSATVEENQIYTSTRQRR